MRPHQNGTGTFDTIVKNILSLLNVTPKIHLTFRINVNENNFSSVEDLLDIIPIQHRSDVTLTMANLFQVKDKLSLYDLYLKAINKGYKFYNSKRELSNTCQTCKKNAMNIDPDGNLAMCSPMAEKGLFFGLLSADGKIKHTNINNYIKIQNLSVFDSHKCSKCIQLPMCGGGCKLSRFENIEVCNGSVPDGLSLEQKIKLHYYSDTAMAK